MNLIENGGRNTATAITMTTTKKKHPGKKTTKKTLWRLLCRQNPEGSRKG